MYGPPASGKLTVAKELARLTGYKLFHNHLTVDLLAPFFDFGSQTEKRLKEKFRLEIFEEASKAKVSLIFTYVYARGSDDGFVKKVISSVENYGGEVLFVRLYCDQEELEMRVQHESRIGFSKIHNPETLKELIKKHDLFSLVPFKESLSIDTSKILPKEAAEKIIHHFNLTND